MSPFCHRGQFPLFSELALELLGILVDHYPELELARFVARTAAVRLDDWDQLHGIRLAWTSLLDLAARQGLLSTVFERVLADPRVSSSHARIREILAQDPGPEPAGVAPAVQVAQSLSTKDISELFATAQVLLRGDGDEEALLAGLPPAFVASLPRLGDNLASRLYSTLHALNRSEPIVTGERPLAVWLQAFCDVYSGRPEARRFAPVLEALRSPGGTRPPSITLPPVSSGAAPLTLREALSGAAGSAPEASPPSPATEASISPPSPETSASSLPAVNAATSGSPTRPPASSGATPRVPPMLPPVSPLSRVSPTSPPVSPAARTWPTLPPLSPMPRVSPTPPPVSSGALLQGPLSASWPPSAWQAGAFGEGPDALPPPVGEGRSPLCVEVIVHADERDGALPRERLVRLLTGDRPAGFRDLHVPVRFVVLPGNGPLPEPSAARRLTLILLEEKLARQSKALLAAVRDRQSSPETERVVVAQLEKRQSLVKGLTAPKIAVNHGDPESRALSIEIGLLHAALVWLSDGAEEQALITLCPADPVGRRLADELEEQIAEHGLSSRIVDDPYSGLSGDDLRRSAAMVVLRTDGWFEAPHGAAKLVEAKAAHVPIIVVEALDHGEGRSFPYLGNTPTHRLAPRAAKATAGVPEVQRATVVRLALCEALRHHLATARIRDLGPLPEGMFALPRAPELLDAAHLECRWLLYPDPPLAASELRVLHHTRPALIALTPAEWRSTARSR